MRPCCPALSRLNVHKFREEAVIVKKRVHLYGSFPRGICAQLYNESVKVISVESSSFTGILKRNFPRLHCACCPKYCSNNVPHGVTAGKLAEYHADKLAPCVVALAMFVAPTLIDDFPNLFFR